MKSNVKCAVAVAVLAMILLLPGIGRAQTDSIVVRYGQVMANPLDVEINQRVTIPIYVYTSLDNYVGDIHLALGTNDQYIDSLLSETEGEFLYPLTEWDGKFFSEVFGSPPNPEGWSSQSLLGWARLDPYSEAPWLHTVSLEQIASMVVKTANDSLNIGDDAVAIGLGLNLIQGPSNASDTLGLITFMIHEDFSPFHFIGGGYIEGSITDFEDNPIEGVSVVCEQSTKESFSDEEGAYHMGHYPGTFNFIFSHPDYVETQTEQTIVVDQTISYDVTLDRYGIITGTVTDYLGNPLEGVEVTTSDLNYTTGADGVYTFTGLETGSYDVAFSLDDFVDTTATGVDAELNGITTLDMTLHQLAGIAGQVTYVQSGDPLAGIIVTLGDSSVVDTTDASGNYLLDLVTPGTYEVIFDDPINEYQDSTVTDISVTYDTDTQLNVALDLHVGINDDNARPLVFELKQNYPNPFNAKTTIEYSIDKDANVMLDIYDVLGRLVVTLVNEYQTAGIHKVVWNSNSLTSGIYFYKLQAGNKVEQKSMMLLK